MCELKSGECTKKFVGNEYSVNCIKIVNDDKLISGDSFGLIKIWKIDTSQCLKTITAHTKVVRAIKFLYNERFATCSDDKKIKLFNLTSYAWHYNNTGHCR